MKPNNNNRALELFGLKYKKGPGLAASETSVFDEVQMTEHQKLQKKDVAQFHLDRKRIKREAAEQNKNKQELAKKAKMEFDLAEKEKYSKAHLQPLDPIEPSNLSLSENLDKEIASTVLRSKNKAFYEESEGNCGDEESIFLKMIADLETRFKNLPRRPSSEENDLRQSSENNILALNSSLNINEKNLVEIIFGSKKHLLENDPEQPFTIRLANPDWAYDLDDRTHAFLIKSQYPDGFIPNNPPKPLLDFNLWFSHHCAAFIYEGQPYVFSHVTSKPVLHAEFLAEVSFDKNITMFLKAYQGRIYRINPDNFEFCPVLTSRFAQLLREHNHVILKYNDVQNLFKNSQIIDKVSTKNDTDTQDIQNDTQAVKNDTNTQDIQNDIQDVKNINNVNNKRYSEHILEDLYKKYQNDTQDVKKDTLEDLYRKYRNDTQDVKKDTLGDVKKDTLENLYRKYQNDTQDVKKDTLKNAKNDIEDAKNNANIED